jgi:hypothetical protein
MGSSGTLCADAEGAPCAGGGPPGPDALKTVRLLGGIRPREGVDRTAFEARLHDVPQVVAAMRLTRTTTASCVSRVPAIPHAWSVLLQSPPRAEPGLNQNKETNIDGLEQRA